MNYKIKKPEGLYKDFPVFHEKRVMGIEPTYLAWKASVLPLNYTRMELQNISKVLKGSTMPKAGIEPATRGFSVHCSTN